MRVERAGPEAVPLVMRLERQPGYEALVGRWSEAERRVALADAGTAYLLGYDVGSARGFAILQAVDNPHGNVRLRRLAVEGPGQGFGRAFLEAVVGWVFTSRPAHRLFLNVFEHNARARRFYLRARFTQEGIQRESHRRADGTRVSMALMSILRPEWEVHRAAGAVRPRADEAREHDRFS